MPTAHFLGKYLVKKTWQRILVWKTAILGKFFDLEDPGLYVWIWGRKLSPKVPLSWEEWWWMIIDVLRGEFSFERHTTNTLGSREECGLKGYLIHGRNLASKIHNPREELGYKRPTKISTWNNLRYKEKVWVKKTHDSWTNSCSMTYYSI